MIELCSSNPDFKFSYETTAGLIEYLEKNPARKDDIRRLLESGQLDVGGLFVSANAGACSEEAVVRNFCLGKRWLEKTLDFVPLIAKEYDTPGHILQTPQLVKDAGMDVLVITRGPHGCFYWLGPDGSEILTCCIPYNWSYWRKLGVSFEETEKNLAAELERAARKFSGPDLIIPDGDDMTLPNANLLGVIEKWNRSYDRPKLSLSTLQSAIAGYRSKKFLRRSGDMPNMWIAIHTLQVETARDMKHVHNLLPIAEMLHSILCIHKGEFKRYPSQKINQSWRRGLLVADHNWGGKDETRGGVQSDEHKRELARLALRDCHWLIEDAFYELAKTAQTEEPLKGMPVMVFNPLAWPRTDISTIEVTCEMPGLRAIEIVDADDKPVPFDMEIVERHSDGTAHRVRADFLCRDLPSLGYSSYFVKPVVQEREAPGAPKQAGRVIENEFYRVEFAEDGSRIQSLYDKELDRELAGTFNVSMGPLDFEFGLFELFGIGLKLVVPDDSFYENPENEGSAESVEPTGEIWRAQGYPASVRVERDGDFAKSLVAEGEFLASRRRQRVVLFNEIKRIDLHLELDWDGVSNTALYLQMPHSLMNGQKYLDVPFAVHKNGNELTDFWIDESLPIPFKVRDIQNWLCFESEGRGLAIATRWPIVDFTIVPSFPLLWTNDSSGFFFGERYRQRGKHNFSFSLTSYKGGWLENGIHRWGRQWAIPPMTFLSDSAMLPRRRSYLSVVPENIIVSAFKKAEDEDAVVIRLYETAGKRTDARMQTAFPVKRAIETNIIETASKKLAVSEDQVRLNFRPFEIKTIKLFA